MNRYLDPEKALEAVIYVSQKNNDLFHIVKILYYADKLHLERYGQFIFGDCYKKMEDGPVPSAAYDLIKIARGNKYSYEERLIDLHPERELSVVDNVVKPKRKADEDYLSESNIECLNEAISKYSEIDGGKLWEIVHQENSYKSTEDNGYIPVRKILLEDIPNGRDILEYLDC